MTTPDDEWQDDTDALRTRVVEARRERCPLRIRGGGTKDWYGDVVAGEVIDTRAHRGVVNYDPPELVVTARAGTRLAHVESLLAAKGQRLAFDPPQFGADATLGGCVAAGLAGPRRVSGGAVRDAVLGATLLDGRGEILHFGGEVMKNVAGYDVARLLAGSLGIFGVVLDVSLKVVPIAPADETLLFDASAAEAIERLNRWAGQPLPIAASAWIDGRIHLRLSGAVAGVAAARARLGGELLAARPAEALWSSIRERSHAFFSHVRGSLVRLALPSTAPPLEAREPTLIEWHGGQRWVYTDDVQRARAYAVSLGGHATLATRNAAVPMFTPVATRAFDIHRRLKAVFDPDGVFNRGRLYRDL